MASASEIRIRINSVSETKKVTDAMYMISSVKMRKAKRGLDSTKPYFIALREEIGDLLQYMPANKNRYFRIPDKEVLHGKALLLITSDKGLAGNYNQEAIRRAEKYLGENSDTVLFPVGEYGRQYFLTHKGPIAEDFICSTAFPTIRVAQRICEELLEYYRSDKVDEINIIYTAFRSATAGECRTQCLLPLNQSSFYATEEKIPPYGKTIYPDADTVLNGIVPPYLTGFIYSALVESYCSEQQARMNAMQAAGDNAEDMLKDLRIQFNSVRQAAITREITEITAGAKALRAKREKLQKEVRGNE